jgi:glycosyltransferase involved in cell wall biosynthesis
MKRWPKISIITPSFNQCNYIEKTINSVLDQDYPNLEYIVMDGGSTDGSVEIIRKYGDRITYWESQPDHGQSDAINKGFRLATGDIISWINSDDVYVKGAFARVASYFTDCPDDGMVYGDCDLINEDGHVYAREQSGKFDLVRYLNSNYIPQPTVFLRRTAIECDHLVDESLHYAMDYELWLRVSVKHQIGYIPSTMARFRYHMASKTMSQNSKFAFEHFLILHDFMKCCDDQYQCIISKKLIQLLPQINREKIVPVIDALQADIRISILNESDRLLINSVMNGDTIDRAEVKHAIDKVSSTYLGYFNWLLPKSSEEANDVQSIFIIQLVTIATTIFSDDPRRSRRMFWTLLSVQPRLLLNRCFIKLLWKVMITPSGDRLLTSLRSKTAQAYIKGRIIRYKLMP